MSETSEIRQIMAFVQPKIEYIYNSALIGFSEAELLSDLRQIKDSLQYQCQ